MLETLEKCPVCSHSNFSPFLTCKDYTVSAELFSIVACNACNFLFTNPRPTEASIEKYYQSENYISHSDTKKGLIHQIYHKVRQRALRNKLKLINQLVPSKGSLLDVGCGTGYFLQTCSQNNWQVMGTEPDENARNLAQKNNPAVKIADNIFNPFFDNHTFNCITLWHVLEHIHQLDYTLARLKTLLKPEGYLLIAVPNAQSIDAQWFMEYWAAYDVPRHLYHFTPQTIKKLFTQKGFTLNSQKMMPFDAFYISLLSNRYKNGKTLYFKSFWQGLRSNYKAKKVKGGNSSSMLYIFKK